jgi:hypothetical protein
MEDRRCARAGCNRLLPSPKRGQPRRFCSDACRNLAWKTRGSKVYATDAELDQDLQAEWTPEMREAMAAPLPPGALLGLFDDESWSG